MFVSVIRAGTLLSVAAVPISVELVPSEAEIIMLSRQEGVLVHWAPLKSASIVALKGGIPSWGLMVTFTPVIGL